MPPKDKQKKAQEAAKQKAKVKVRVRLLLSSSFQERESRRSLSLSIDGSSQRESIDKTEKTHPCLFSLALFLAHHQTHKQTVEDKTFGLKNKNKSSKVQK